MPPLFIRALLVLMFLSSSIRSGVDGEFEEEWCIADEQTPDEELERASKWACENGGDCGGIRFADQPCYFPNTTKHHASFAFNTYYQRLKHKGGTCYFNAAAIITSLNPGRGSCKFEFLP